MVLGAVGFSEDRISEILETYPDSLSEGEKHRLALARALMTEPELLILDEPTGTIDPITTQDLIDSILLARKELGQTFIIISHDPDFVERTCDRVVLMRTGKIVCEGTPTEVVQTFSEMEKPMRVDVE